MDLTLLYLLIKRFEGCRLTPYLCPAGVWTCGWGSTGPDVFPGVTWTQAYADKRLEHDAVRFATGALALCPELATQPPRRLCAIADFAYNLGLGRLKASTLRKRVRALDWSQVCKEMMKWVRGGGRELPGLVARCKARVELLG